MSDPSNDRPAAPAPQEERSDVLPPGTRLAAEFDIREVLGIGGFGIVYRAWDEALQRDVALKEYMPISLAGRGASERVTLRSRTHEESFALGLQSFVNEARLLARFDQPALVKVFRFWEANGTAYMAMPLYKGRTLRQLRKEMAPGAMDDAWIRALIEPLLGALEVMHDAAVYHRDIAPDNILWCDDGRPVLLDFGAARLVLSDRTQNVTAILKPQFAPIEQYAETQSMRQGPWTDLYALAGTCYFMLTGRAPLPATARVMSDELEPLARLAPPGCSTLLLQVLDWAMSIRPQDRPQSVAQMRDALAGRGSVPLRAGADAATPATPPDDFARTIQAMPYDKTIRVSREGSPPRRQPASTPGGAAASAPVARTRDEPDLDTPDRSVMLPPKSPSSAKALWLLLVLGALAAGGWATRPQWMPWVGLQVAVPAPASVSSAVAPMPALAPELASAAGALAGPASAASSPSTAAAPASASTPVAPLAEVETPPVLAAHSKSARDARNKALAARLAALTLPPPTLPPADESHRVASGAATEATPPPAAPTVTVAAEPAPAVPRGVGPREVCAELDKQKAGSCLKQMCESERYQAYPVCKRLRRLEEQPQRGASP